MGQNGDDGRPPAIPDLLLPVSRPSGTSMPAQRPAAPAPPQVSDVFDGFGGLEIERGAGVSIPSSPRGAAGHAGIDISGIGSGVSSDFDDMEIERGGSLSSPPASRPQPSHAPASRPSGAAARPSGAANASGLELAVRRPIVRSDAPEAPSTGARMTGWLIAFVPFVATFAALAKFVHASRSVTTLAPHAFDATSPVQSGGVAVGLLVIGTTIGVVGLRMRPRSWALLGSAATILVSALAMVTVALVATEEHPTPADGALLIPYAVPLGIALIGCGIAGRAAPLFLRGGWRRAGSLGVAFVGGLVAFAGFALSALARFL